MKSKVLRISSILSWLWGILLILIAASIAYPFIIQNQFNLLLLIYLAIMLFVATLMCLAGYGIWKQKKPYNKISIIAVSFLLIYSIVFQTKISLMSIVLGISILIMVVAKWKAFT